MPVSHLTHKQCVAGAKKERRCHDRFSAESIFAYAAYTELKPQCIVIDKN